jgi:hypothetical protein
LPLCIGRFRWGLMVDFLFYTVSFSSNGRFCVIRGPSITGDFTLVVDLEFGAFGTVPGRLGFWYIGISATTLGRRCTLF